MTATITATPEPAATPPRVRLNVTTDQSTLVLYRVAQDGTKTVVRSYDGGPFPVPGTTLLTYDVEAPLGLPVSYTADGSGVTNSAVVTLSGSTVWLTHVGVPARSRAITVKSFGERQDPVEQSVRYPLNRKFPVVASDGRRKAPTYEMTVLTRTLTEVSDIEAILDDLTPLLLQVPASKGWGVVSEYVNVGPAAQRRLTPFAGNPDRDWALALAVVARPIGGAQTDNTYAKSFAAYPTYAARFAAAPTYGQAFNQ